MALPVIRRARAFSEKFCTAKRTESAFFGLARETMRENRACKIK
jgi:hypothetical protein